MGNAMKNLLIYISPTGSFDNPRSDLASNDAGPLAKVQIENSLQLGWKAEDILLVTNFPFKYGKIKAHEITDVDFFDRKPQVSKINAIIKLIEDGVITERELYWFHDLDAFQLEKISEDEIAVGEHELGVTEYGGLYFAGQKRISTGVLFFRASALPLLRSIKERAYKLRIDEEEALGLLMKESTDVKNKVIILNHTYNFIGYSLASTYKKTLKPLKVVHFHPLVGKRRLHTDNALRFFRGDNPLKIPLITDRVVTLLKYHRLA